MKESAMPTVDLSALPSYITPQNLVEFAGGTPSILKAAWSFRPGTDRWQERVIAEIYDQGNHNVTLWLQSQVDAHMFLFTMQHGQRPAVPGGDPDQWDDSFQAAFVKFFTPHFELVFPAETREEDTCAWLDEKCPDLLEFAADQKLRQKTACAAASAIVDAILHMRAKPGQLLSMLGIVADDSDWPKPSGEPKYSEEELARMNAELKAQLEAVAGPSHLTPAQHALVSGEKLPRTPKVPREPKEPKEPLPPREKRARVRKSAITSGGVHFSSKFIRQLQDESSMTSKEIGEALGTTPCNVNNGIAGPGLVVGKDAANGLLAAMHGKLQRLQSIIQQTSQALVFATDAK
jgi:hypothetical protein